MINLSLGQIADVLEAECPAGMAERVVGGVSTDSRQVKTGDLFFAIPGEKFDGHDFVAKALLAGAVAAVVEKDGPREGEEWGRLPVVKVGSVRRVLGQLAKDVRGRFGGHVVAITGSNGKTTTRRMLGAILRKVGKVCEAPKSFNNDVGVPLTVLAARADDDFLLCEVGTNHPGEIGYLADIVRPGVAIVTCAGPTHLEGFGTVEAVAQEKVSLLDYLAAGGLAIINGDDAVLAKAAMAKPVRKVLFGMGRGLMWQCRDVCCGPEGSVFRAADDLEVRLAVPGRHNALNALAALAAAGALGDNPQQIAAGLREFKPAGMRLAFEKVGGVTIINDAYNANPASVAAGLEVLAMAQPGPRGRRVALLGDMLELGAETEQLHRQVGQKVAAGGVDLLITSGQLAQYIGASAVEAGMDAANVVDFGNDDEDFAKMAGLLRAGDVVLLKGSRGMRMERLIGAGM